MSYSFIQTPAELSLSQSPVIFAVSSSILTAEPNFQYVGELSIWTGSLTPPATPEVWTLAKYPSSDGRTGIFDCSRIINSTQTQLVQQNISPVNYFQFTSYSRYWNGTTYVTGSAISSSVYKAIDGYQVFPEVIGEEVYNLTPQWPIMSDAPATQSVFIDNVGEMGVYVGDAGTNIPTSLIYSGSNGSNGVFSLTTSDGNSNNEIVGFPIGPAQSGFPLSTTGLESFTIRAKSESFLYGEGLKFNISCQQKYPNIRIKWKNRFGEFDYLNFDMINRKSISSDKRTYQPQLGSWTGRTLSYNEYDSQTLNYIVDSKQNIICNTNWLSEDYNETLKQLLVSNEIYWCLENTTSVKPLTIVTSNIQFKTGVNDHLIQYQFEFAYGQGYKLII